jgi:hypothetical protein
MTNATKQSLNIIAMIVNYGTMTKEKISTTVTTVVSVELAED